MEKPGTDTICSACGTALQGKYCHACGEKRLDPHHDFSVLHFLEETFESFTHLDSRVIRSFRYLFTRPGFLTAEFIAGRRVPYLKPVPLFLVAALVFFLFFPTTSAFYSNPGDMNRAYEGRNRVANMLMIDLPSLIDRKAKAHGMEAEAFVKQTMEAHGSPTAKTWLFLLIPLWGLFLWGIFFRKIKWYVPHAIFALHGMAFFVLFDTVSLGVMRLSGFAVLGDFYILYLILAFMAYCVLAVRRVYAMGWLGSILAGIFSALIFFLLLNLYRQLVTVWVIWGA